MKEPKYLLRIGAQEFAVPSDSGIATVIKMMEDALPVHADLAKRQIELSYTDRDDEEYLRFVEMFREVRIRKIPAGVRWTRKTKAGTVEIVHIVPKRPKALPSSVKALPGPKQARLGRGREPLQLEFGG